MLRMLRGLGIVAVLVFLPGLTQRAEAIPLLQLDMKGGVYDPVTETIVAPGGSFTVYAILTPPQGSTQAEIDALLNTKFYLSAALTPQTPQSGGSYGSFQFGLPGTISTCRETTGATPGSCPQTVNVTSDMAYGVPPLEQLASQQGWDSGDLSKHGIYPTYFSEFSFKFSSLFTTSRYNVQDNPGGPSAGTGAYYAAFVGNSALLNAGYHLHFDLYSQTIKDCSTNKTVCTDADRNQFAPFSHDAETTQVPEPSAALLILAGLLAGGRQLRPRRSAGAGTTAAGPRL